MTIPSSWRRDAHTSTLETPCWLLDYDIMQRNLDRMADYASNANLRLRPHIKTHKIPEIARQQVARGAVGIATAKFSEAESMAAAGITDIVVVYQPADDHKRSRLVQLAKQGVDIACTVDDLETARALSSATASANVRVGVYLEININDPSGSTGRCGVTPMEAPSIAAVLDSLPGIAFRGILGYRGVPWLYASAARDYDLADVRATAAEEARLLRETAARIRDEGVAVKHVVAGSTPTAMLLSGEDGVNEIQPGEYVFLGATHVGPGLANVADCALSIRTTVVSATKPGRAVIDAGSKVLAGDINPLRLPNLHLQGLGIVRTENRATTLHGMEITSLSEEHGSLTYDPSKYHLAVGDVLDVIPVHVCTSVNLAQALVVIQGDTVMDVWPVECRGFVW